jgi:peptide-methionine (S)-S-oxide reductase
MKKMIPSTFIVVFFLAFMTFTCQAQRGKDVVKVKLEAPQGKAIAAFASGCFWCVEHVFEAVVGVDSAVSGYAGGHVPNPYYELVNTETTGHAETVLVYYNPDVVDFEELCKIFFLSHDPTTPNRQGPDYGTSYRSILFYMNEEEKATAERSKAYFANSGMWKNKIVTELKALDAFYRAEEYHQDYIEHNPNSSYVRNVSVPRFNDFVKKYDGRLKEGYN